MDDIKPAVTFTDALQARPGDATDAAAPTEDAAATATSPAEATASFNPSLAPSQEEPAIVEPIMQAPARTGAWWTLPLMCVGICMVACAVLVPAADENRRAMYEMQRIQRDVAYFQQQSDVNKEFLDRVANDPALAERLAMRQLRLTRPNTRVVEVPGQSQGAFDMSPFALVSVPPPEPMPEYQPVGGTLGELCRNPRSQLYLIGLGLLCTAAGVIFGGGQRKELAGKDCSAAIA